MFRFKIFVICSALCARIRGDVSSLVGLNSHPFRSFNGYNYNPPSHQLPSPAPPASTTFLPEIIVNKAEPANVYLPPPPTTENPIILHPPEDYDMNAYLPPFNEELPPPQTIDPPQSYLPPETIPDNQYLPPQDETQGYRYSRPKQSKFLKAGNVQLASKSAGLHISVNSLRCIEGHGGFFQVNIGVQSFIDNLPIIDLDAIDARCQFRLVGVRLVLNIPSDDFQRCGIFSCGSKELCAHLRFPQIFAMKSLDDSLLTLKCKLQERIVSKTHAFRFGVSQSGQARNAVVFAHGGGKQHLRTQLGLYRQSGSGFTKTLDSGAFVQLGEELLLRAQVKAGDGWNHSRVSDVSLQQVGPNGEILNSAMLIKANGCINPQMQSICSNPPIFEPPLGYRFGFKAVMFQGMKSGDEMIMNVRIIGCIDVHDCQSDHVNCADEHSPNRVKRQSAANKTHESLVEVSNISFRVVMPSDFQSMESISRSTANARGEMALFITIALVSFFIVIAVIVIKQQSLRPYFVWDKY